jgi:hypothetical protein
MRLPLLAWPFVVACSALDPVVPPPQEIVVRVTGDPGQPLEGATLQYSGKQLAKSDGNGVAQFKLDGKDGDSYDLQVSCPSGFLSPSKPLQVRIKRLADDTTKPEFDVSCLPTSRTVVVAIRAENGPNLPVLHLGKEVSRTDGAGAAHVMFTMKPHESINLVLSTQGTDRLRPQNPAASFTVRESDDIFIFDQKFELEKKKVVSPRQPGPVRIRRGK